MKVYRGLHSLPKRNQPAAAATIGNFYAVHKGHALLLKRVAALARTGRVARTVITFEPHPQEVLHGRAPALLITHERKVQLLKQAGVEQLIILAFTAELSRVEPEDFVASILVEQIKLKSLVVGANFRFGRFARGDVTMLRSLGKDLGFKFETARLAELGGRSISSTAVRHAVEEGDLAWANKALGRSYSLPGRVVKGAGRGKDLGYPTANLQPAPSLVVPGAGIYAGRMVWGKRRLPAAISVGHNPTFGQGDLSIEAYVLDFRGDLYEADVEFEFDRRLRDHVEFPSASALKAAIADDVAAVRKITGRSRSA